MNKFITILFLLFASVSYSQNTVFSSLNQVGRIVGKTYYFSTSGSDGNNGTTISTPWKNISKLQTVISDGTIKAGDVILFKNGDSFLAIDQSQGIQWWRGIFGGTAVTGTFAAPITVSSYGTGAKPKFQFPNPTSVDKQERACFSFFGVQYINIIGLDFTDTRFPINDKTNPAYCSAGILIGGDGYLNSNSCRIINCDFSNIGNGLLLQGDYNYVNKCTFTNLKNIVNTISPDYEDYGANGVTVTGNNNIVSSNYFDGNWAASIDFGYNGGAVEMYGSSSNNQFIYNTLNDCNGFAEFGSGNGGNAYNNLFAYNKIVNCGMLTFCSLTGTFTIDVQNVMYYNNSIVENDSSRYSGANLGRGADYTHGYTGDEALYKYYGSPGGATMFQLKNNIFQLSTGITITQTAFASHTVHQNNIYKLSGGSSTQFTLGGSELSTSGTLWTNTTSTYPATWDFTPSTGSAAISFGQNVGLLRDFNGKALTTTPDAGAIQK